MNKTMRFSILASAALLSLSLGASTQSATRRRQLFVTSAGPRQRRPISAAWPARMRRIPGLCLDGLGQAFASIWRASRACCWSTLRQCGPRGPTRAVIACR